MHWFTACSTLGSKASCSAIASTSCRTWGGTRRGRDTRGCRSTPPSGSRDGMAGRSPPSELRSHLCRLHRSTQTCALQMIITAQPRKCKYLIKRSFLANVNSRSRSLYAVARPSVVLSVCNARAPYSGGWSFRQYFYGIWYLGHPLTFTENFMEIVPGEPLRQGS